MISIKERNYGMDKLKFICAFLVVCIHSPLPGICGAIMVPIARIAVPIFFMISGYYSKNEFPKKQVIKILKLILISNIIYFLFNLFCSFFKGNIDSYLYNVFNLKALFEFLFFNSSSVSEHLWYLNALLYTLIIVGFLADKINFKKIYFIIPILLIGDLIFGKYSLAIFNTEIPYIYVRNFLFVGIPYFLLGKLMFNYKNKLNFENNYLILIFLSIIFMFTTLIEKIILVQHGVNATRDHYISTTFLAVTVFLLFNNYMNKKSFLSIMGKKYSTFIYLYHPLTLIVLATLFSDFVIYKYIAPFLIFVLTIVGGVLYDKILNIIVHKGTERVVI